MTTSEKRPFPDDYYDERGIYIPRLYGRPWNYWYRRYGATTMKQIQQLAEEERMDLIGLNGNVGYTEEELGLCPDKKKDEDSQE